MERCRKGKVRLNGYCVSKTFKKKAVKMKKEIQVFKKLMRKYGHWWRKPTKYLTQANRKNIRKIEKQADKIWRLDQDLVHQIKKDTKLEPQGVEQARKYYNTTEYILRKKLFMEFWRSLPKV